MLPLEKEMATTPVLLPGESHGWRSLVGYSPQGCKESDTTERLDFSPCTPKEGRRVGQMWRKKPDTWPEERQRPRRTALYK